MNRMTPNMDPPDERGSVEFKVDGHWFAWDEHGVVYIYLPEMAVDFEDGYVPIGEYTPPDEPEFDWRGPLTAYAREYLRTRAAAFGGVK